ncbi:periplasmic solute binding protein family protein [mine drainage metagenome]|uniref:Periplasmic solute binding protein family protein n=1 Tax=mine drainage metagenome TaxID=410659 RepID=A0A1J5QKX8_9ZZZZ
MGASGATLNHSVNATVNAYLGNYAYVRAANLMIAAANHAYNFYIGEGAYTLTGAPSGFDGDNGGWNVNSGSGGFANFPAGSSTVTVTQNTNAGIGSNADVNLLLPTAGLSDLVIEAYNEAIVHQKAKLDSAGAIATALSAADPARSSTFTANAAAFTSQVAGLESQLAAVKAAHAGTGVAITEPVPVYLLTGAGLVDKTPAGFTSAIEAQSDVSPTVMQAALTLLTRHQVEALVYNEQTMGPQTTTVLDAAKSAGVPVVPVTETLPHGKDYISWMSSNIAALTSALGK